MKTEHLARLLERRDDVREWAVFADSLEADGDPRGALVSLMLSREGKPTAALSDALRTHAQLLLTLTPDSLGTLATRGHERLAPIFRRGFIHTAGAIDTSDFEALRTHPSCALLEAALLAPGTVETLEEWLATVTAPLPWRHVELALHDGGELDLARLFTCVPHLESLRLKNRVALSGLSFPPDADQLKHLHIDFATSTDCLALSEAWPSSLKSLHLVAGDPEYYADEDADSLLSELLASFSQWRHIDELVLTGTLERAARQLLEDDKPKRLRVFSLGEPAPEDTYAEQWEPAHETSFALISRALTPADDAAIVAFAKLAGVRRLQLQSRELTLGARTLTAFRLHGEGDAPLIPRVAVQQLVKKDRQLDAVTVTVSESNNLVNVWAFGPHLSREGDKKDVIPVLRRDESHYRADALVREALDGLLGFDPGIDVREHVVTQLTFTSSRMLIGDARANERLPLFSDAYRQVREDENEDEYDESQDVLDRRDQDEDEDGGEYDEFEDLQPDQWGGEPINVPDFSPKPAPVVAAEIEEDDPDDDLDPPLADSYSANEGEVWNEGPVDLPEHQRGWAGDTFCFHEEPGVIEEPLPTQLDTHPCAQCHQVKELARCSMCREEVCRDCAGVKGVAAWDDQQEFTCRQCTPRSGARTAVKPRQRE